jgi:hypothetical protein
VKKFEGGPPSLVAPLPLVVHGRAVTVSRRLYAQGRPRISGRCWCDGWDVMLWMPPGNIST